jgi:hypothetical protein
MWAQVNDVYQLHTFHDGTPAYVQIANPGEQGTPISTSCMPWPYFH